MINLTTWIEKQMKRAPSRYKFDYQNELLPLLIEKMCEMHHARGGQSKSAGSQWWLCEPFLSSPSGNGVFSASLSLHEKVQGRRWDLVIRTGYDNGVPPTRKSKITVVDVVEREDESNNFETAVFQYAFPHVQVRILRLASFTRLEDMARQLIATLWDEPSTLEMAQPSPLPSTWFNQQRAAAFDFMTSQSGWRKLVTRMFDSEYVARYGNIVCGIGFIDAATVVEHVQNRLLWVAKKHLVITPLKNHFNMP